MKKVWVVVVFFISFMAVAQEEILMPSSFDENKMIVKRKDENGNFVPVDELAPPVSHVKNKQKSAPQAEPILNNKRPTKKFKMKKKTREIPASTIQVDRSTDIMPSSFSQSTFYMTVDKSVSRTLSTQTMERARQELEKENTVYEECNSNDPNCKEYELDEQGRVIVK